MMPLRSGLGQCASGSAAGAQHKSSCGGVDSSTGMAEVRLQSGCVMGPDSCHASSSGTAHMLTAGTVLGLGAMP